MPGIAPVKITRAVRSQYSTVLLTQVLFWRVQCTSDRLTLLFDTILGEPPFHETAVE